MASIAGVLQQALLPVGIIVAAGYLLRRAEPGGLQAATARHTINQLVMYLFYPALVLDVVTSVALSVELLGVPLLTAAGVLGGMAAARLLFGAGRVARPALGALLLACGFSNTISIGLPVLDAAFGPAARRYGIYADLLAIAPLLWIGGVWIGAAYGTRAGGVRPGVTATLLRLPPVWALLLALLLNLCEVRIGGALRGALEMVGPATIPCMLLTLGMSLSVHHIRRAWRVILAAGTLKLVCVPALVYGLGSALFGRSELVDASTLEAAMPTMMATIIISDRFGLDTEMLASVMVGTTLLCFVTVGPWIAILA